MRYALCIQYLGTDFHGWQVQPKSISVQEVLQKALLKFLRKEVKVVGCGRTDTGVHASNYIAHIDLPEAVDTASSKFKLNNILPKSVSVSDFRAVPHNFHARFTPVSRTYKYIISNRKDAYLHRFSAYFDDDFDMEAMNDASVRLLKYRDFASFCKAGGGNMTTLCKVEHAFWERKEHLLVFEITADRFLRNMVRALAGTLINVGRGKITAADFERIVLMRKRSKAGFTAPARGLHLCEIEYPTGILPRITKNENPILNG